MLEIYLKRPLYWSSLAMLLGGVSVIVAALLFEHVGGFRPCELCLIERKPWYFAAPGGFLALFALKQGRSGFTQLLLGVMAVLFILNAGLAFYHSGVEWKWWLGPSSCTGDALSALGGGGVGNFLDSLNDIQIVRCDEAQFRLFGLSFSGYNTLMSAAMALIALSGIFYTRRAS